MNPQHSFWLHYQMYEVPLWFSLIEWAVAIYAVGLLFLLCVMKYRKRQRGEP
jgi:hypothetical protein